MKTFLSLAGIVGCLSQPLIGPYETARITLPCDALDGTDPEVMITYPTPTTEGETFPLIAYAHGAAGGGFFINGYDDFFHQLSSYGFVVAAHKSCAMGMQIKIFTGIPTLIFVIIGCFKPGGQNKWTECANDVKIVSSDGWAPYFGETLKTIDWTRNSSATEGSDPVFQLIDFSNGVGVAGHSMGGQSSTLAANTACTKQFDIRAVALHHPANGQTSTVCYLSCSHYISISS
jgi:dienelactone hydrolase